MIDQILLFTIALNEPITLEKVTGYCEERVDYHASHCCYPYDLSEAGYEYERGELSAYSDMLYLLKKIK